MEGALRILQSFSITWTSPSDSLVLYPGHLLWAAVSYTSAEMQAVYSTVPTNRATKYKKKGDLLKLRGKDRNYSYPSSTKIFDV